MKLLLNSYLPLLIFYASSFCHNVISYNDLLTST